MLDLMLQLSSNAFKPEVMSSLEPNLLISRRAVFPEEITEEEKIDWFKYLLEGSEKFKIPENDEVILLYLSYDEVILSYLSYAP